MYFSFCAKSKVSRRSSVCRVRAMRPRRLSYEQIESRMLMSVSPCPNLSAIENRHGLVGPAMAAPDALAYDTTLANLTAYRPQMAPNSYLPFAKTAVSDQLEADSKLGPGIRIDGNSDNANLVEVRLDASGVNYVLQRADANLRVWKSATKAAGTEIVFSGNVSSPVTSASGSSVQLSVWVQWAGAGQGTSTLTLKPKAGSGVQDGLVFHTFHSIVIAIGGETFGNNAPPSPSSSVWQIGNQLYNEGYDVYLHNEDDVATDGSGAAYNEIYKAVHYKGVTQVAIVGYSHGGGDTYFLANRLNNNRSQIGTFTIAFTAYVDAIENLSDYDFLAESRRPPGSAKHMNYYRGSGIASEGYLHGVATKGTTSNDYQLDVLTTTWGKNATHNSGTSRIDALSQVRTGIHNGLASSVIA
jgi:hypothetical protein